MKHKMSGTRFYNIWCGMKQRCFYPKHSSFHNYGAKGITVCEEWLFFEAFYQDMYKVYEKHCEEHGEKNTTLDRIDSKGSYCKNNCKWSSTHEQQQNRTNNHLITYNGTTKTLSQWSQDLGFFRGVIENRLRKGWTVEQTLTLPRFTVIKKKKLAQEHKDKIKQAMLKHFA